MSKFQEFLESLMFCLAVFILIHILVVALVIFGLILHFCYLFGRPFGESFIISVQCSVALTTWISLLVHEETVEIYG